MDEYTLARGIAVGLLVGFTPTVGIQTWMMLAGSFAFRANFIAAFIVSNVSNPFTMAPLYYGFNRLGSWLLQRLPVSHAPVTDTVDEIAQQTLAMFIGSLVIAIPASALGYLAFLWLWRKLDLHKPRHKPGSRNDSGSKTD